MILRPNRNKKHEKAVEVEVEVEGKKNKIVKCKRKDCAWTMEFHFLMKLFKQTNINRTELQNRTESKKPSWD